MKAKTRFFALFLAVITVLTFSAQVLAAGPESAEPVSPVAAEHGDHVAAISPRMGCTACKIGTLIEVCEKQRYWDSVGEHDSWGKRCLVNYFRSGGHYLCETCGDTRPFDYADENNGQHLCVKIHSYCGEGTVSICTLNVTAPPGPFPYN